MSSPMMRFSFPALLCRSLLPVALSLPCCRSTPPEPQGTQPEPQKAEPIAPHESASAPTPPALGTASAAPGASASASASPSATASAAPSIPVPPGHRKVLAKPVQTVPPAPGDPLGGKFTLQDATRGLGDKGTLIAEIRTELGKLDCELYEDRAPITVANFVGLARGIRPFKNPAGEWVKTPAYDGLI